MRFPRDHCVFPRQPVRRGLRAHVGVRGFHQPRVRSEQVRVALRLRNTGSKLLPHLGEEAAYAAVEPVDLGPSAHRHAGDDDLRDALRAPLGVREDQRRSPRPSRQQPPLDPEVLAEAFHVCEQVLGRVHAHVGGRIARVRQAPPTAALVEEHDQIAVGVE